MVTGLSLTSTQDEIRTLVSKRSDFEHLVLAPRASVEDFLNYAAWEQQLDALRAARCKRMKIRSSSSHQAQARTFTIFERGITRHPGSIPLWMAYLDFAAKVKATKRWKKIVARALRMHPAVPALWVLAGRRAAKDGDMDGARGYFMRGCRFCTSGVEVWAEYARVEMEWIGKLEARKAKSNKPAAGPQPAKITAAVDEEGVIEFEDDSGDEREDGELMLPDPDAMVKRDNKKKVFNDEAIRKLESKNNPALDGAIPKAIFDIARKQPFFNAPSAEGFFNVFATFTHVGCQAKVVQHVLDSMQELYMNHPATRSCYIRQPLIGVDYHTAEFPKALREALARLRTSLETTKDRKALVARTLTWFEALLALEDLDASIRTVLEATKRKLESS